ncbi:DUF952 domain-containing protein [Cellulomonas denverensis]|uniref:DUF952 domain-containing protein n=1 Tax=Cellulomonas denverensis TaxID=264297 RepID=A0A7X6KSE0_9CELL|nr:DUF952 domain-containing protein [Cellulomonas denverensis]NKY21148.1 DUF952 domain-containing protein [Cellulomonas denverensis]
MTAIQHLALRTEWDAARRAGVYRQSTLGRTLDQVGFIHCSAPHQLAPMAEFVYADVAEPLCVLTIDRDAVERAGTRVLDEDGGGGETYPHLYGALRIEWVTRVEPARIEDGRLRVTTDPDGPAFA